ncbi:hypothetical protein F183_A39360 [Bryobacterales bacterium F-183]|nr:hypothetical protein F183_A39360 [Bryobacterales bacterium F-183]
MILSPEIERLAATVAGLAHESTDEAIRRSLVDRLERLTASEEARLARHDKVEAILAEFRAGLPPGVLGKSLSKQEEDEILGYGPDGV